MAKTKNVNEEVKTKSSGLYDHPIPLPKGSKKVIVKEPGNISFLIRIHKESKGSKRGIFKYVVTVGSTGNVEKNFKKAKANAFNSASYLFGLKYGSPSSVKVLDYTIQYAEIEGQRKPKRENWNGSYRSVVRDTKGRIITWSKFGKRLQFESDLDA